MADEAGTAPKPAAKLRIFISYSRVDKAFAVRLADALVVRGYAPDFDQATYDPDNIESGISAEDEWWQRLQQMITSADVMVFVVSPDSAASMVCDEEIAYARGLGKRIIPILVRPVDFAKAPPRLSALNVKISFVGKDHEQFDTVFVQLCTALDLDIKWFRESRRLTELAVRWDAQGRPESLLLSPTDVSAIGDLLERRPRDAPEPPAALLGFRDKSREKLNADDIKQRRIVGRAFVKPAERALEIGLTNHSLRLAATGVLLAKDLAFDTEIDTQLWEPAARAVFQNRVYAVMEGNTEGVSIAAFGPDSQRIVTVCLEKLARIWDAASGQQIALLEGHTDNVRSASFSPDGNRIVTASGDKTARVWDVSTGRLISTLRGHTAYLYSASFSRDGQLIATTAKDSEARIWDAATGGQIAVSKCHRGEVFAASFSPDGRRFVTASFDKTPCIWDAATGHLIAALHGHTRSVTHASFSPDGQRIVTASGAFLGVDKGDKTARIWDAATGRQIALLQGHRSDLTCASFSPDGQRIVTASWDATARVWDSASGQQLALLEGHTDKVKAASFSSDGAWIVTASDDTTARVWVAASGKLCARLQAHAGPVNTASFSPDGTRILTASDDKTVRLWDNWHAHAITQGRGIILTAALAHGNGQRTAVEAADLLMQDAPEDLYAEACRQLGREQNDPEILKIAEALRTRRYNESYLSPSLFAETFGLRTPAAAPLGKAESTVQNFAPAVAFGTLPTSARPAMRPKRILALDGGGARGMISLALLAEIEAKLRKKLGKPDLVLADYFDLIGGTSVGAMIGTLLALGKDVAYVRDRFEKWAPRIFKQSTFNFGIISTMYDARVLRGLVQQEVRDWTMRTSELKTGLCIVSKRVDTGSVWPVINNPRDPYFEGRPAKGNLPARIGNGDYTLLDLIRASTAAPRYFSPKRIRIFKGPGTYEGLQEGLFVDGGVSPHNNPALQLFMMAGISGYNLGGADLKNGEKPRPWALGAEKLMIVSVGTGTYDFQVTESGAASYDAVNALQGMVSDGQELALTMLQWMSTPAGAAPTTHWPIDRVLGDLSSDLLGSGDGLKQPLLTFRRYDVRLERDWLLEHLGQNVGADRLAEMRDFTNPAHLKALAELGNLAAKKQVRAEHFPDEFDAVRRDRIW